MTGHSGLDKDRPLTARVALLSLAGVVLSAAVGAGTSLLTAKWQADAQVGQSIAELRRANFTAFVQDADAAMTALSFYFVSKDDQQKARPALDAWAEKQRKVYSDLLLIKISGPDEAYAAAQATITSMGEQLRPKDSDGKTTSTFVQFKAAQDRVTANLNHFADVARTALSG